MKIILCLLFCLLELVAIGQGKVQEFYSRHGNPIDRAQSYYYSEGIKADGTGSTHSGFVDTVLSYYTKTNTIKSKEFYNKKGVREGPYREYHTNGELKESGVYKSNQPTGDVSAWYVNGNPHFTVTFSGKPEIPDPRIWSPKDFILREYWDSLGNQIIREGNGYCSCQINTDVIEFGKVVNGVRDSVWNAFSGDTLVYSERYLKGKFLNGISFLHGKQFSYDQLFQQPEFKGGLDGMVNFLKANMNYPKSARRAGIEGTVYVQFVVGKIGQVLDASVLRGVDYMLDEEAMRVVREMGGLWVAGKERGKPVYAKYVLPIKFRLH
jgi:TonB family protein